MSGRTGQLTGHTHSPQRDGGRCTCSTFGPSSLTGATAAATRNDTAATRTDERYINRAATSTQPITVCLQHFAPTMVHLLSVGTLALLSAAVALPATKRWAPPVVDLGYASYQGVYNETTNIQSFQGIRYAAPPIGDLRWRAPQPPSSMQGLQDASKYGSQCIQGTLGGSPLDGLLERTAAALSISSEDCLFLNVYLPPNATVGQGSRPVVVWIHGGGYTLGSGTNTRESDRITHRLVLTPIVP